MFSMGKTGRAKLIDSESMKCNQETEKTSWAAQTKFEDKDENTEINKGISTVKWKRVMGCPNKIQCNV